MLYSSNTPKIKIYYKGTAPLIFDLPKKSIVQVETILAQVNKFIVKREIEELLPIFIKCQGEWKPLFQVLDNQITDFLIQIVDCQPVIEIDLTDPNQYEKQTRQIQTWSERIQEFNKRSNGIEQKVLKDTLKVQDDDWIDLAFFYAQPLRVIKTFKNTTAQKEDEAKKSVSFLREIRKLIQKLDNERGNSFIRSANIEVSVATLSNLKKILGKGVKILHFSCHGLKNKGLQMELQSRQKIGLADIVSCQTLKTVLEQYKLPEIIIFNVCYSASIAKQIHEYFWSQGKHVTTVGYTGQISDSFCEAFAQAFYSKIFNSFSIAKSMQACPKHEMIEINFKTSQKIAFDSCNLNEQNKLIQIKNKTKTDPLGIGFPKRYLYTFLPKCLSQQKPIINLIGPFKIGKTQFIRKSLSYIWQRSYADQFLLIDMRQNDYQLANIVEFRCKLRKCLNQTNMYQKIKLGETNYIISIDHCDSILKYNMREFKICMRRLLEKIGKNKLLIVSRMGVDRNNLNVQVYDLTLNYGILWSNDQTKFINPKPNLDEPVQYIKMNQFLQDCHIFKCNYFKRDHLDFINTLPAVNIFPDKLYEFKLSNVVDTKKQLPTQLRIHQQCQRAIKQIIHTVQSLKQSPNIVRNSLQLTQSMQQMYIIAGVQYLLCSDYIKYTTNAGRQKFNPTILRTVHKLINICLIVDSMGEQQIEDSVRLGFKILFIKLHYIVYILNTVEDYSVKFNEVVQEFMESYQKQNANMLNALYGISLKQLLKVNGYCKFLYEACKGDRTHYTAQITEDSVREHLQSIKIMKQKVSTHSDKIYHLFQDKEIKMLLLPVLRLIKQQLQRVYNRTEFDEYKVKNIIRFLNRYQFLDLRKTKYCELYTDFYATYVESMFYLQIVKLKYQGYLGRYLNKFQAIERLNIWIELCKNINSFAVKQCIENYKEKQLNMFPIFVSFPFHRIYRFQNQITISLQNVYKYLGQNIFPVIQNFSSANLQKINQLNITIPIALYISDALSSEQANRELRRKFSIKQVFLNLDQLSRLKPQNPDYIEAKNIQFLKSSVTIMYGRKVINIPSQIILRHCDAVIYINTEIQEIQNSRSQQLDDKIRQKLTIVTNALIAKAFLINFYQNFVKAMFPQQEKKSIYANRREQIQKSVSKAKLLAKIMCFKKFGIYYEFIEQLCENVSYKISLQAQTLPPLILNISNSIFQCQFQQLYNKASQQQYLCEQQTEVAYCQQIQRIMRDIDQFKRESKEPFQIRIVVCKHNQTTAIINNLYLKIRRMPNTEVSWLDTYIRSSQINNFVYEQNNSDLQVSILDLTSSQIEVAQMSIFSTNQIQRYQTSGMQWQRKTRKMILIFVNEFPLFENYTELKSLIKIDVNILDKQNLIPILCHRAILKRMSQKQISRKWEQVFIDKLTKKIANNQFSMDKAMGKQRNVERRKNIFKTRMQNIMRQLSIY